MTASLTAQSYSSCCLCQRLLHRRESDDDTTIVRGSHWLRLSSLSSWHYMMPLVEDQPTTALPASESDQWFSMVQAWSDGVVIPELSVKHELDIKSITLTPFIDDSGSWTLENMMALLRINHLYCCRAAYLHRAECLQNPSRISCLYCGGMSNARKTSVNKDFVIGVFCLRNFHQLIFLLKDKTINVFKIETSPFSLKSMPWHLDYAFNRWYAAGSPCAKK